MDHLFSFRILDPRLVVLDEIWICIENWVLGFRQWRESIHELEMFRNFREESVCASYKFGEIG